MANTQTIHALVAQARRRLRLQAALEWGTLAVVPAATVAAAVVFLLARETIGDGLGVGLLVACGVAPVVAGIAGSLRRFPDQQVATKIDRASGLSDRLATACAFEVELARPAKGPTTDAGPGAADGDDLDEAETRALMRAAVGDAIAAAPRANVKAATPFAWPRDTKAALAFAGAAALVSLLNLAPKEDAHAVVDARDSNGRIDQVGDEPLLPLAEDDLEYARALLEEVKAAAEGGYDPAFTALTKKLEELLSQAERGEISREELLAEMNRAHDDYMKGGDEEMLEESLGDLQKTGKELAKEKLTEAMGQALAKGDLEQAKQEMEKLAEKLANGEVSEADAKKAARALERAAEAFEKRQSAREKKAEQKTQQAKDEVAKAQKQVAEAKTPEQKEQAERRLRKKQDELKQAQEQEQRQQEAEEKRTLKRLHRNMKKAAEQMNQPQQQDQQENQRQASRTMEDMARDTGKVDADKRKITNQKKVASQLSDLKEALRRGKRGGSRGPQDRFGRNKRNADFQKRARGGQGSKQAWKPGGKGQGQPGQGNQPGGQGNQPGGSSYGDGHDPDLLGESTAKKGNTEDESVSGVHGKGPSIRETILSSAQKGFASQSYKQVYARYKTIVEEVIHAEKVPSGYKYYVKKYFQKIKPHEM